MFSSVNPFGGLSAANILTLFNAISSSSSRPTSDHSSRSSSNDVTTGSAEAIKEIVTQASASDPAKAIKTILAQALVQEAQNASSQPQSVAEIDREEEAQAEKVMHEERFGTGVETYVVAEASSIATLQAQASSDQSTADGAPSSTSSAPTDGSVSLSGASTLFSSLEAVSQAYSAGVANFHSLGVITPKGVASIADTNEFPNAIGDFEAGAFNVYQSYLNEAQEEEAASSSAAPPVSAPVDSSASDASGSAEGAPAPQSYLRLAIHVTTPSNDQSGINTVVEAQAQQLVTAFENGTLGSASSDGSGFSYVEALGQMTGVQIVGTVVSGSDNLTDNATPNISDYQSWASEMTQSRAASSIENLTFFIPLAAS